MDLLAKTIIMPPKIILNSECLPRNLKLAHYGIQSNTHQWIATWLTTRTQNVIVEGERSKDKRVLSGVPQGTVLGP